MARMRLLHVMAAALALALLLGACRDDGGDRPPPVSYRLTVGDTVITITNEAVGFANEHYSTAAYFLREYQVATDSSLAHPGATFQGTIFDWRALPWDTRRTFLLPPYTRDIRIQDNAEFYYQIGTFTAQFGYGWRDTFDPEASLNNAAVHIWQSPADTTLQADNPATIGFDGESRQPAQYRARWVME